VKTAVITLCREGALVAEPIVAGLGGCDLYLHEDVEGWPEAKRFSRVIALTAEIFAEYSGLVYIMPCGVVVRAIAPCLEHKLKDPAVVMLDIAARHAVSLLSGHEGGANELAQRVGNLVDAEPVISTTTEAIKTLIVGVGCRKGAGAQDIQSAIEETLAICGASLSDVRLLASADVKREEPGLLEAAAGLELPLRFISSDEIRCSVREDFAPTPAAQRQVNLPAVAEPAALLAGKRTELICSKQVINSVTVAVARERCTWWDSVPADG
jgi:cobalt-precorrin 5A hydrolase